MLKGIPKILSPELLKVLCEMGHGDTICIGDGNFPAASTAKDSILIRADGHDPTGLSAGHLRRDTGASHGLNAG